MKKLLIYALVLSIFFTKLAYAKVGVVVDDPGMLPAEINIRPYAETLNATRYAPWFLMYHMQSETEKLMGRRGGEGGQIVMSIANSPINPDLMLMGNDTCGLWRSSDGGQNWYAVNNNINMWSIPDIQFDMEDENIAYIIQTVYGSSESTKDKLNNTSLAGVYKSIDGGETWNQILEKNIYATSDANHLLAFDDFGSLYVLTSEGVMKTNDGGDTWEDLGSVGNKNVYDLRVSADGQTIITACEGTGISASFDSGATWQQKNDGLAPSARAVAIIPNYEGKSHWMSVYAGNSTGLYESFDQGDTWLPVEYVTNGNGTAVPRGLEVTQLKGGGTPTIYLVYSLMSYPLRYSNDFGKTWKQPVVHNQDIFGKGITGYYSEGIHVDYNDPDVIFYSFGDIIYRSNDGGANFHYLSSGFSGNYSNDFVFDAEGKIYFPFTDKGLAVTTEPYTEEIYPTAKMIEGIGSYKGAHTVGGIGINPRNPNHMIIGVGKWEEQILKETLDGGLTWRTIEGTGAGKYDTIVFHPEDPNIIYTNYFTSRDGGETWEATEMEIWDVSRVNSNILWSKDGRMVCRSNDGGETWSELAETSEPKEIVADLFDENIAWVGCYNGSIVKFEGNKRTTYGWNDGLIGFDGKSILIEAIAQNPRNPLHLLAGGRCTVAGTKSPGLYETTNGGRTWSVVPGLPSIRTINSIKFSPNTDEAFLGTYNGTIIYEYNHYHNWTNKPVFSIYKETSMVGPITAVGVVDKAYPDKNDYETRKGSWPDIIGTATINGVEHDRRIFYQSDLTELSGKEIISAELVLTERRMSSGTRLEVYPVTSDWTMETISYNNLPEYKDSVIAYMTTPGYQDFATVKSLNITEYVKDLVLIDNNTLNLMIKSTNNNRYDSSYIHGINSNSPPYIQIVYRDTNITDTTETLLSNKIFSSCWIKKEMDDSYQSAVPILALYNGRNIEKIAVGETRDISKITLITVEIDLSDVILGPNHQLKMFVWDGDIAKMKPILNPPGILTGSKG